MSDDDAYAESLFRTAKYRPEFSAKGFADLQQARAWGAEFVRRYNVEHRHSGIGYVSPGQRHAGEDHTILAARHAVYQQAHEGHTQLVTLRCGNAQSRTERDCLVNTKAEGKVIQPLAA